MQNIVCFIGLLCNPQRAIISLGQRGLKSHVRSKEPCVTLKEPSSHSDKEVCIHSTNSVFTSKSPIFTQKIPIFTQKCLIFTQKSSKYVCTHSRKIPVFTQKGLIFTQKSPVYVCTHSQKSPIFTQKSLTFTQMCLEFTQRSSKYVFRALVSEYKIRECVHTL